MLVRVLGPVEVWSSGAWVSPAPRQRLLLSLLVVGRGVAVPVDRLAEEIWGDGLLGDPLAQLYTHVARLRRVLGDSAGDVLVTRSGAYVLNAESDLAAFEQLTAEGRLEEALSLWRGAPFADAGEAPMVAAEAIRLDQVRLGALEARIDADLDAGRHREIVTELQTLTAEHPLREVFWRQLMLALYRCGRQADALEGYQQAYRLLDEELGLEPGPGLRRLQQQILETDPALDALPVENASAVRVAVPRQVPPTAGGFTGREAELDCIGTSAVSVVSGMGGVGKTALVVRWAHRHAAEQFPDGQVWVDLRGYGPGEPLTVRAVRESVCRTFGVDEPPVDEWELAELYRSQLDGRRMLLVLDNAGSVEQVRPLLPGSESCTTVVTSRDDLAGLVARDGASRLLLNPLPESDASALLEAVLGTERIAADPAAGAALIGLCGGLPLALRIAAERAQHRPDADLVDLVTELADHPVLDALDVPGDAQSALRTVFSWSYEQLPPAEARLFGLLGLHPGPSFDIRTAANLAEADPLTVRRQLDVLARAHLIEPSSVSGRYRMHDLIRAYAVELVPDNKDAVIRLLNYYLHAVESAADRLDPDRIRIPHDIPPPVVPPPSFTGEHDALAWLEIENDNIVAAIERAADSGHHRYPWRICCALKTFHHFTCRWDDWLATHTIALQSTRAAGDLIGEAWTTNRLAAVHGRKGNLGEAIRNNERAVELSRAGGDRDAEAGATYNLGFVLAWAGRSAEAEPVLQQAVTMYRELGDVTHVTKATHLLVEVHLDTGLAPNDIERCGAALRTLRDEGSRYTAASLMSTLAMAHRIAGHVGEARQMQAEALATYEELGDKESAAIAGYRLADTWLAGNDPVEAASHAAAALQPSPPNPPLRAALTALLALAEARQGDRDTAAEDARVAAELLRDRAPEVDHVAARQYLGEAYLLLGDLDTAGQNLHWALQIAESLGLTRRRGLAHRALGDVAATRHDHACAVHHWNAALDHLERAGALAEAAETRVRLPDNPASGG